jgi:hypothetical protein
VHSGNIEATLILKLYITGLYLDTFCGRFTTFSGLNATFSIITTTNTEQMMQQLCWNAPQVDLYALTPGRVSVCFCSELCAHICAYTT